MLHCKVDAKVTIRIRETEMLRDRCDLFNKLDEAKLFRKEKHHWPNQYAECPLNKKLGVWARKQIQRQKERGGKCYLVLEGWHQKL